MAVVFLLFKGMVWCISKLPFPFLYALSDLLYFNLYYIFKYRKKVVFNNLRNSFPEKGEKEIEKIGRKFYQNLSDIILEVFKTRSLTRKQILSRYSLENFEIVQQILDNNQSVLLTLGHCGNWEWMGNYFSARFDVEGYAIVKPLTNKRFNDYMNKLRHRFSPNHIIYLQDTFREMVKNKDKAIMYAFVADQTPTKGGSKYWFKFLNQDTSFFIGIEKMSKSLNTGVVFMDIQRTKRGHYKCVFQPITSDPRSTKEFEITEKYVHLLEQSIRGNPDNWLWSHRRWKHKRENQQIPITDK